MSDEKNLSIKVNKETVWKFLFFTVSAAFLYTQVFGVAIRPLAFLGEKISGAKADTSGKTKVSAGALDVDGSKIKDDAADIRAAVLPADGAILPIQWGDLGKQLVDAGVIDSQKFESIYANRGGLPPEAQNLLYGKDNSVIVMNSQNSGLLLNLLWAFGLANKNVILEKGPMQDPQYGGADKFASTGGWTLSRGNAMEHYSKHRLVKLTSEQQTLVEKISKNIYRPCCNNSTYFPDCNHGMAMLGLIELLAARNIPEQDIYAIALKVNSFWFPNNYTTIAKYFQEQGFEWSGLDPRALLGAEYSSSRGYKGIEANTEPIAGGSGGGGCGV